MKTHKCRKFRSAILLVSLVAAMTLLTGCKMNITGGLGKDAGKYTAGGVNINEKVESLDIEWADDKIEIIGEDVDSIIIDEEDKNLAEDQKVQWWLDGSTLRIRYAKANVMGNVNKNIKILIPKETEFKNVEISVASAELTLENINAENMTLDSASGDICGSNLNAKNMTFDSASGDIEIKDAASESVSGDAASGKITLSVSGCTNADFSTASGGVELDFVDVPKKLNIDAASGSIDVSLPENADFTAAVDTASGKVNCDIPAASSDGKFVAGNGSNSIKIDTASGSVHIKAR